jgi:hypothetical protein
MVLYLALLVVPVASSIELVRILSGIPLSLEMQTRRRRSERRLLIRYRGREGLD